MVESDVRHTPSTRDASRHVDVAFLPSAFARDEADPLRAIAFWNGQHPYVPVRDAEASALRSAMRAERIGALARLVPQLIGLANDPRPEVRATFATCFSILARAGQAPADREVWRALLGLAKYDEDEHVRDVAERALADFEHCGTFAKAS